MSVTLLAFGRRGYAYAAANMVASLRYYGYGGAIHLHVGASLRSVIPQMVLDHCTVHDLPDEYASDPGWCKVNLPKLITEDTLYLDVDGLATKNVQPLIDACVRDGRHYITSVLGKGKDGMPIDYYEWATTTTVRERLGLPEEAIYYGIQSSWCWMKKGKELDDLQSAALMAWDAIGMDDLRFKWGTTKPDELFYSAACTITKHDPSWSEPVVFFGKGFKTFTEVQAQHYVLSLWGTGRGRGTVPPRYVDQYDTLVNLFKRNGNPHVYRADVIRKDKWVNFKTERSHAVQVMR